MAATIENVDLERKLAQKLACNEKTVRDRAIRKLRKYFEARSQSKKNSFSRDDMIKLWKGLHYCMWMSDKPLVQEELSESICSLVHSLKTLDSSLLFIDTFFETEAREWFGIDRLRLDKFMMLFRRMLHHSFNVLKKNKWKNRANKRLLLILTQSLMNPTDNTAPDGLKMHIVDIYLNELSKEGAAELSEDQVLRFLEPYVQLLAFSRSKGIVKKTRSVFNDIVKHADVRNPNEESKRPAKLRVNYERIADRLFEVASSEGCPAVNRKTVYNLVKKFRDLAQGIRPKEVLLNDSEDPLDKSEIGAAVGRLYDLQGSLMKESRANMAKKKKKAKTKNKRSNENAVQEVKGQSSGDDSEAAGEKESKDNENAMSTVPGRKRKKRKNPSDGELSPESIDLSVKKKRKAAAIEKSDVVTPVKKFKCDEAFARSERTKCQMSKIVTSDKSKVNSGSAFEAGEFDEEMVTSTTKKLLTKSAKKKKRHSGTGLLENPPDDRQGNVPEDAVSADETKTGGNDDMTDKPCRSLDAGSKSGKTEVKKRKMLRSLSTELSAAGGDGGKLSQTRDKLLSKHEKTQAPKEAASPMISFEKVRTPPAAFIKKAASKASSAKKCKEIAVTPKNMKGLKLSKSEKKRVSFIMARNTAQEFAESLTVSPAVPFKPDKIPDQGILKSSPATTPRLALSPKKLKHLSKQSGTALVGKSFTPTVISMREIRKKKKRTSL